MSELIDKKLESLPDEALEGVNGGITSNPGFGMGFGYTVYPVTGAKPISEQSALGEEFYKGTKSGTYTLYIDRSRSDSL